MRAISLLVLTLLLCGTSGSIAADVETQPPPPRSGDALWDAYAALLDEALTQPDLEQAVAAYMLMLEGRSPLVPRAPFQTLALVNPAKLDALESQFGGDPRYWQLRYFEAWRHLPLARADKKDEDAALDWLRKGAARGATDFTTDWILLTRQVGILRAAAATTGWLDAEQKIRSTLDAFIAKYPDQSMAHYERAMFNFELGQWEDGLARLEQGNAAVHNDCPRLFPISFLMQRIATDETVGNEVAAGIVAVQWGAMPIDFYADTIKMKDHIKEEQVRLELGAPFGEIAPWHRFSCRLSMQRNALATEGYMGYVFDGVLVGSLFVDFADSFTVRQRAGLRELDSQLRTYRANMSVGLAQGEAQYPMAASLLTLTPDKLCDQFRNGYRRFASEVELTRCQAEAMQWLYRFDWDNMILPPNELPQDVSLNEMEMRSVTANYR